MDGNLKSPAELLNGLRYQSNLPLVQRTCKQNQSHKEKVLVKQARSKDYHDSNAKELGPLSKGQNVLFELNPDDSKAHWSKGVVLDRNDRSYTVKSQIGHELVRNRVNLRQLKNQTDKHTDVRQLVLIDKSEKASLIKKDNSVPRVTIRSR